MGNKSSGGLSTLSKQERQDIQMSRFKKFIEYLIVKVNKEIDNPETPLRNVKLLQKEFKFVVHLKHPFYDRRMAEIKAKYVRRLWKCKGDLQRIRANYAININNSVYRTMVCEHMSESMLRLYKKKRMEALRQAEKFLSTYSKSMRYFQNVQNSNVQWDNLEKGELHKIVKNMDLKGYSHVSMVSQLKYSSMQSVGISPRVFSTQNSMRNRNFVISETHIVNETLSTTSEQPEQMDLLSLNKSDSKSHAKTQPFTQKQDLESLVYSRQDSGVSRNLQENSFIIEDEDVSVGKIHRTSNIYNLFDKSENTGMEVVMAHHQKSTQSKYDTSQTSKKQIAENPFLKESFHNSRNLMNSGRYRKVKNSRHNKSRSSNIRLSIFDDEDFDYTKPTKYLSNFQNGVPGQQFIPTNDSVDFKITEYLRKMRRTNTK